MILNNVIFPGSDGPDQPPPQLWDIEVVDGVITSIKSAEKPPESEPYGARESGADTMASQLLLPTLCHPHLHLDKAYLLTGCCGEEAGEEFPSYSDLVPQSGSFPEALQTTAVAKSRFTAADLRRRGMQLLASSYAQGVTSARVFVEVDAQAAGRGKTAVAVVAELQALWKGTVDLQVCAFAQEVLFTGEAGTANRVAIEDVLRENAGHQARVIDVIGVTPYVEATRALSLQTIDWAVATALEHDLHLDLHLDYNLQPCSESEPLIFALVEALVRHKWTGRTQVPGHAPRTVVVGHATQLTRMQPDELRRLATLIQEHGLPIHLVGLPTSDLYMMGRQPDAAVSASVPSLAAASPPRGTLNVVSLARDYGLRTCLGVNNVGNAFTPYGTGDPLQLACWGVGLYHAARAGDAAALYGKISWAAREAIGLAGDGECGSVGTGGMPYQQVPAVGTKVGRALIVANPQWMKLPPALAESMIKAPPTPARPRLGFRDVVWDPPDVGLRRVV